MDWKMFCITCYKNMIFSRKNSFEKREIFVIWQFYIRLYRRSFDCFACEIVYKHRYTFFWKVKFLSSKNFIIFADYALCNNRNDSPF